MRFGFLIRPLAVLMALGAGAFFCYKVNERREKFVIGSFWSLGQHTSIDHFELCRYDTKSLVVKMIHHPFPSGMPYYNVPISLNGEPARLYDRVVEANLIRYELDASYFSDPETIINWSEADETGDFQSLAIYYFVDKTRGENCPRVVGVKISPGLANTIMGLQVKVSEVWRNLQIRADLESSCRDLKLIIRNYIKNSGYEATSSFYSQDELEALRMAAIVPLTHLVTLIANYNRVGGSSKPVPGITEEMTNNGEAIKLFIGGMMFDWPGAYHTIMPPDFDRVVMWHNLGQFTWLASLLVGTLVCARVGFARDPHQRLKSYSTTSFKVIKKPFALLWAIIHSTINSIRETRERRKQERADKAEAKRREDDRQRQFQLNEERRRQKEEERQASMIVKIPRPAPEPYKLEPAKPVEAPKPVAKVLDMSPDLSRGSRRQLLISDLESLVGNKQNDHLDALVAKCSIKKLEELYGLLQVAYEQKPGGVKNVQLVLVLLSSKRVPMDHLHPSTEFFKLVLEGGHIPKVPTAPEQSTAQEPVMA